MKTNFDGFAKHPALMPLAAVFALLLLAAPASAVVVATASADVVPASPDVLAPVAPFMDELGDGPSGFPPAEAIGHASGATALIACAATNGAAPNALVTITNLTGLFFANLHYVAAAGAAFTNFDGTINGASAFRIDTIGPNAPLLPGLAGESIAADGIFAPGETWSFIVDDYAGPGPPDAFYAPGVPGVAGPPTASIVADVVPEPGSLGLLGLGALAILRRRVRKV